MFLDPVQMSKCVTSYEVYRFWKIPAGTGRDRRALLTLFTTFVATFYINIFHAG